MLTSEDVMSVYESLAVGSGLKGGELIMFVQDAVADAVEQLKAESEGSYVNPDYRIAELERKLKFAMSVYETLVLAWDVLARDTGLKGDELKRYVQDAVADAVERQKTETDGAYVNLHERIAELEWELEYKRNDRRVQDTMAVYEALASESGLRGDELKAFVRSAVEAALEQQKAESDGTYVNPNERIAALEGEVTRARDALDAARKELSGVRREVTELKRAATESAREIAEANRRIKELREQADTPEVREEIAKEEAAVAAASQRRAEELAAMEEKETHAAVKAQEKVDEASANLRQVIDQPASEATDNNASQEERNSQDISSEALDDGSDLDFAVDSGEASPLPDLTPEFADSGTTTPPVGLTDGDLYVGSNLTWGQGKTALVVAVNAMLSAGDAVTEESFVRAVKKMFPALPAADVALVKSVYSDAVQNMGNLGWSDLVKRGPGFTYEEDDKDDNEGVDTASGDRAFDRNAARELTSKDLKNFLSLARYASTNTGANLQGFLVAVRELVARQVETDPTDESSAFLNDIVNPRARTEYMGVALTTYNQREAVFHHVLDEADTKNLFPGYIKGQWKHGNVGAFLLSYLSVMNKNDRARFSQLIANAASCDPAHYRREKDKGTGRDLDTGTIENVGNFGKRTNLAAVAGSLAGVVNKSRTEVQTIVERLMEDTERRDPKYVARGEPSVFSDKLLEIQIEDPATGEFIQNVDVNNCLSVIRHNRTIIADKIAEVLGEPENPICNVLRSETLMRYLERIAKGMTDGGRAVDKSFIIELAGAMSYQATYVGESKTYEARVGIIMQIVEALSLVAYTGTRRAITAEELETAALAVFTAGSSQRALASSREKSTRFQGPLLTLFNYYVESLPHTVMNKEIDRVRPGDPGSIAITSRGVIPILARWMDDPAGFRYMAETYFKDEVGNAVNEALAVHDRRSQETRGRGLTDEEKERLGDIERERVLGRCRQEMVWPDGTRILAKNITEGFDAEEVYDACRRASLQMKGEGDTFFVPVYAGDHSSAVLLQCPYRLSNKKSKEDLEKTFGSKVTQGARDKALAELGGVKKALKQATDALGKALVAKNRANEALENLLVSGDSNDAEKRDALALKASEADEAVKAALAVQNEAKAAYANAAVAFREKFAQTYDETANWISESIGLGLLGDDTKRSAVSSLEQAGLSMIGLDVIDVPANEETGEPAHKEVKFGHCYQHVFFNFNSRKAAREGNADARGNEELKGSTLLVGYGAERQRQCAKTKGTGTLKCHLISTAGRSLTFLKSLCVSPFSEKTGTFVKGDCKGVMTEHMMKGLVPSRDTACGTDADSYKIGDLISKWLQVRWTKQSVKDNKVVAETKEATILDFLVDALDERYHLSEGGKLPDNLDLDAEFAGTFEFVELVHREGREAPTTFSEVLPGLKAVMVEGMDGPTLDFVYLEDGLTSYNVANVSHTSSPTTGRMARNYETDAMTMAAAQLRDPNLANYDAQLEVFSILADWGALASTVFGSKEAIGSLIRTSSGLRDLSVRGESPDGMAMMEELFRTAWARKRQHLNIPVYGVDAPLISAGAGASLVKDKDGNILYDEHGRPRISMLSDSKMLRDLNYGSVVYTDKEKKFYKVSRRLGLCAINTSDSTFRYGWWLDSEKFDKLFLEGNSNPTNEDRALAIEKAFVDIHEAEQKKGSAEVEMRAKLMSAFVDHHGQSMDAIPRYIRNTTFDDLFIADPSERGKRMFDRSAVQWADQDLVHNDGTGKSHIFLGGTMTWLPRTPSYNGTNWAQVVRASIPVTERKKEFKTAKGTVVKYIAGYDAMVSPDPLTNEILGSDHDGDKAKIAFLQATGNTGLCNFDKFDSVFGDAQGKDLEGICEDLVYNGKARQDYFKLLREKGYVQEKVDPESGETVLGLSDALSQTTSNRFVRAIMDMARNLPCPEATTKRVSFLGGVASQAMEAFPGSEGKKNELLGKDFKNPTSKKVIPKGRRLSEAALAARVTAYANDANDARARAVSLAKSLHFAWASGYYCAGDRDLFHNLTPTEWYQFIHLVDGLSNATSDDSKSQICARFGWTKGMLNAFVTDFLLGYDKKTGEYAKKLPTTKQEADRIIDEYVTNVNSFGSRYYMMQTSATADKLGFKNAIRETLLGKARGSWADFFGIEADFDVGFGPILYKTTKINSAFPAPAEGERVEQFLVRAMYQATKDGEFCKKYGLVNPDTVLKYLAYGTKEGQNPNGTTPGYLVYLLKECVRIATEKGLANVDPADPQQVINAIKGTTKINSRGLLNDEKKKKEIFELIGQFIKFQKTSILLEQAREFSGAFNYVAADPGFPWASQVYRRILEHGSRLIGNVSNDKNLRNAGLFVGSDGNTRLDFLDFFKKMHAVTRMAYETEYGLAPIGRIVQDAADTMPTARNDFQGDYGENRNRLFTLAADHKGNENLARAAIGALALDPVGDFETGRNVDDFHAKIAGQTSPFVIAAFQTVGDRTPLENAAWLSKLAEADRLADDSDAPHDVSSDVFHVRRAIETLFEVARMLCTTSTEHYGKRVEANPAFGYFFMRKDTKYAAPTSDGLTYFEGASKKRKGYGHAGDNLYSIQSSFAGGTEVLVNYANELVKKIREGKSFAGERHLSNSLVRGEGTRWVEAKDSTIAKSFDLTVDNLKALLAECAGLRPTGDAKEDKKAVDGLKLTQTQESKVWARDIRRAIKIVEKFETVSMKTLFDELLPFYIAMTTRTVGAPSVQGASLLNLYRDVYAKWSDRQAKNRRTDPDLYDYSIATNFAPTVKSGWKLKRKDKAQVLVEAEGFIPLTDEVPDGRFLGFIDMRDPVAYWRCAVVNLINKRRRAEAYAETERRKKEAERRTEELRKTDPNASSVWYLAAKFIPIPKVGQYSKYVIPRANPDGRYITDIFAGDGLLPRIAEYFLHPVTDMARPETFGTRLAQQLKKGPAIAEPGIDEKDVDPEARKIAYAMRALVGSWADVKFTGKTTFTIKGNLRGNVFAESGNAARAVITVNVKDHISSKEKVVSLASSPAYAASFIAAKGKALGIETVEDFMRLPVEARCAFVRKYSVGAATLNKPAWTRDKNGMAVLCGAIDLGGTKADTRVYHEYFHAMVGMFRQLGMFSEADVEAMQKAFGKPAQGTDMLFDEEKAAEDFRKFVEGQTLTRSGVRSIFSRLFRFIRAIYAIISNGFRYSKMSDENVANTLFSLVIGGVAARSDDAIESIGANVAVATDIADRLGGSVKNSALVYDAVANDFRHATDADLAVIKADDAKKLPLSRRKVRYATSREAQSYADIALDTALRGSLDEREYLGELAVEDEFDVDSMAKVAEAKAKAYELVELLKRDDVTEDRIASVVEDILGTRRELPTDSRVYYENTAEYLADIPENRVEQLRFAVALGN